MVTLLQIARRNLLQVCEGEEGAGDEDLSALGLSMSWRPTGEVGEEDPEGREDTGWDTDLEIEGE